MKTGIIGAGSWGTALACVLNKNGHEVTLWGYNEEDVIYMQQELENKKFLPEVILDKKIKITNREDDLKDVELVVFAVPSVVVRENAKRFSGILNNSNKIIVNVAKGIEADTLLTLTEVIKSEIPECNIAVLSGPSHAEEVGKGLPTTCVAGCEDIKIAHTIQEAFMNESFRIYTNTDVIGIEIAGAFKNLIALATGASDGCGFGDNIKAAIMTRGIAEITRLGISMGANKETFAGLTGVGDLIVTCTSEHSRNRQAGFLIGQGKSLDETLEEIKMVVEGVNTAKAAKQLAEKNGIDMPITREINEVLFNNKNI
ncbi:MAG: NAD(P)H-dependent glycerol-3-phosphate dehydrogenase, partial [bacterium]